MNNTVADLSCLQEDYLDEDVLLSFESIRKKTMQTLYNEGHGQLPRDKSPKGSVDEPIQPLVDLINHHSSFSTLSTCSGRISLFDPTAVAAATTTTTKQQTIPQESIETETYFDEQQQQQHHVQTQFSSSSSSGKGFGGWLLVSHDEIESRELLETIMEIQGKKDDCCQANNFLSLRFEPMLMHVAAANLERGQQLLQLVLRLGFRESGLIVTKQRVTVAIRSYSLALAVPFVRSGPMELSSNYLVAFVKEANARLCTNWCRIQELYNGFWQQFFQRKQLNNLTLQVTSCLPNLGLWGHASVLYELPGRVVEIFVFGGYGQGPCATHNSNNDNNKGASRSDKVYKLVYRHGKGWETSWEETVVYLPCPVDDNVVLCHGVEAKPCRFSAREGLKAISWASHIQQIALLYGGRKNPASPLGELLLYDCQTNTFLAPIDIRGEPPDPRWGHTLTKLSPSTQYGDIALLAGGRNKDSALSDFHVVSVSGGENDMKRHLLWTKIDFDSIISASHPRFHHAAWTHDNRVFLFGGLSRADNLLGIHPEDCDGDTVRGEVIQLHPEPRISSFPPSSNMAGMFGQAFCQFSSATMNQESFFLSIGGLSVTERDHDAGSLDVQCFAIHKDSSSPSLENIPVVIKGSIDFGSLVHATCHVVPTDESHWECEIAIIGGGVHGFAFGPQYASSMMIKAQLSSSQPQQQQKGPGIVKMTSRSFSSSPRSERVDFSNSSTSSNPRNSNQTETDVFLVDKCNAKQLRTHLEAANLLNKRFRMAPAEFQTTSDTAVHECIAVPITNEARILYSDVAHITNKSSLEWYSFVLGIDRREMPPSTAAFAAKRK